MNEIREHVPQFVEGVTPRRVEFEMLEQLLAIPWVAEFRDLRTTGHLFYRFSKSGGKLMVECDKGDWWWVVGHIKHPELVDLPEWHG
jgi:hypothetical protein